MKEIKIKTEMVLSQPTTACSKLTIETPEEECEICSKLTIKTPERLQKQVIFVQFKKREKHLRRSVTFI